MAAKFPQKLIGTLVLAFAVCVGVFGTAKAAQAFFLSSGRTLLFDAVVGTVSSKSITVYTTSTTPITIAITHNTNINGGIGSLTPGEAVKIVADRRGRGLTGQAIQPEGNVNDYGTAGSPVLVTNAVVVASGGNSFVVRDNGVDVTFSVTSATRFFNTSFAQLKPGDRLVVIGDDTGSSATGFVASDVFR